MLNAIFGRYKHLGFYDILLNTFACVALLYISNYFYTLNYLNESNASYATIYIENQQSNQIYYSFRTRGDDLIRDKKLIWPKYRKALRNYEIKKLTARYDTLHPQNHTINQISGAGDFVKGAIVIICLTLAIVSLIFPWIKTPYVAVVLCFFGTGYLIALTGEGDFIGLAPIAAIIVYPYFKKRRLKHIGIRHSGIVTDISRFDEGENSYQCVYFSYRIPNNEEIFYGYKNYPLNKTICRGDKITIYYDPGNISHNTAVT